MNQVIIKGIEVGKVYGIGHAYSTGRLPNRLSVTITKLVTNGKEEEVSLPVNMQVEFEPKLIAIGKLDLPDGNELRAIADIARGYIQFIFKPSGNVPSEIKVEFTKEPCKVKLDTVSERVYPTYLKEEPNVAVIPNPLPMTDYAFGLCRYPFDLPSFVRVEVTKIRRHGVEEPCLIDGDLVFSSSNGNLVMVGKVSLGDGFLLNTFLDFRSLTHGAPTIDFQFNPKGPLPTEIKISRGDAPQTFLKDVKDMNSLIPALTGESNLNVLLRDDKRILAGLKPLSKTSFEGNDSKVDPVRALADILAAEVFAGMKTTQVSEAELQSALKELIPELSSRLLEVFTQQN